jgi:hypothetical protein
VTGGVVALQRARARHASAARCLGDGVAAITAGYLLAPEHPKDARELLKVTGAAQKFGQARTGNAM